MLSNLSFEIIDLENTSGNPVITRIYAEGSADDAYGGALRANVKVGSRSEQEKYSLPLLVQGLGPSLSGTPIANRNPNPYLVSSINSLPVKNNDWTGNPLKTIISGYKLNPPSNLESVVVGNPRQEGNHSYYLYQTTTGETGSAYMKRGAFDFRRVYQNEFLEYQLINSGLSNAWLSYDVGTGMTNKSIFSYSLEILDSISGASGVEVHKPRLSGSNLAGYSGYKSDGANCTNVQLLLENTGITCTINPLTDFPDLEVCLTGGQTDKATMNLKIKEILSGIVQRETGRGLIEGDAIDNSAVISDDITLQYVVYKGIINYNKPYSGDYICFNSYSFGYTGEYSGQYKTNPPYPEISTCWKYGIDYTSIDTLVNVINTSLSGNGASKRLWIKDICSDRSLSGYYETGGLLRALKVSDNEILIESMRVGKAGKYQFSFYEADRPPEPPDINSLKYLKPDKITIQGANTYGLWTDLDTRSGIKWETIQPRTIFGFLNEAVTGFATGTSGKPLDPDPTTSGVSGHVVRTQVGFYTISGKNRCDADFEKTVTFFTIPSGFECNETGDGEGIVDPPSEGGGGTGISGKEIKYSLLKTGWKFKNEIPYNYYRIVFDNLKATSQGLNQGLHNEFLINNINFYGVRSGTSIHSGETCILGANYSGTYMGYTTGKLTGVLTGLADASGKLCFDHYRVSGIPNTNGNVRFNSHDGKNVGLFTGLVSACVSGTGFYRDTVGGHFYKSSSQCVYFEVPVSGFISGYGNISGGPYGIINDAKWATIQNSAVIAVSGYETGLFTGIIPQFNYTFGDVPCIATITGRVSGVVGSGDLGYYKLSSIITGNPISGHSISMSGTVEASAVLNYNTPQTGDVVFINDTLIIYNGNTGNLPPTYYRNINELTNIINSGSSIFGMSGQNDGTKIYLKSLAFGSTGNGIPLSTTGSNSRPTFDSVQSTGGKDLYYPITPTGQFTGQLSVNIPATGYFSGLATGYLTGTIKQLNFVREFTGIWNLTSGDRDFRTSHWVTGAGSIYQNSGFAPLNMYSGHPDILPLIVNYANNPLVYSTDLARLTVTGYGMNSGLFMILSGQY